MKNVGSILKAQTKRWRWFIASRAIKISCVFCFVCTSSIKSTNRIFLRAKFKTFINHKVYFFSKDTKELLSLESFTMKWRLILQQPSVFCPLSRGKETLINANGAGWSCGSAQADVAHIKPNSKQSEVFICHRYSWPALFPTHQKAPE